MTLEQYFSIVLKQWKLIAISILLLGMGAYVGSKLTPRIYQATAIVEVELRSGDQVDVNSLLASQQLVQTVSQLAVSDPVLRAVASHYKGLNSQGLAQEVTANPRVNSQLFEIDVQDPSPTRAAALANGIAAALIQQQFQVMQQDNAQAQQQIQKDLDDTQLQINTIVSQLGPLQVEERLNPNAGLETQITFLQSQLVTLQQHYAESQAALAQLALSGVENGDVLRLVQTAQPPEFSIRPQVYLNTGAGLLLGLLLGMLLAVLFEQLDARVRSSASLTKLLNWPKLSTVWQADARTEELINLGAHTHNVKSYRILRTNIGFKEVDKPLRSILVTSAVSGEGKSTIAANLAMCMAKAGKTVLLVDANLRHPTLHKLFHLPADKMGLSNALLAIAQIQPCASPIHGVQSNAPPPLNFSLDPFIHTVDIPNLRVIPSGPLPPNPTELLGSKAMEQLLTAMRKIGNGVVILDASSLLGLSDAWILASKVDGTIVVVDITRAKKKNLKLLKELLAEARANVLGLVVNRQRYTRTDAPYSYNSHVGTEEPNRGMDTGNDAELSIPPLPQAASYVGGVNHSKAPPAASPSEQEAESK